MRLTIKYPIIIVTMTLTAALITGVVAYHKSKSELRRAAERHSVEILKSRKAAISQYLKSIRQDLSLMATNSTVRDALTLFTDAWPMLDGDPQETLQKLYIHDNPYPTGEKGSLDRASDGSAYSTIHGQYHPWFRQFLEERGYYDIFMFDTEGNLVYTVFKELDYATNLANGRWKNTNLGRVYRTTAYHKNPDYQAFYDFEHYEPSHGAPASFIAMPVFGKSEEFIGVIAFQMPIGRINEIMQVSAGMGKTGRAYLVGNDLLVRNDTRFSATSEILKTKKPRKIVNAAMEGLTGVKVIIDDKGKDILVAYTSIIFAGQSWAIITEIELAEVLIPIAEMRRFLMLVGLLIGIVMALVGVWFAANLSRPIVVLTGIMKRLVERDLDVVVPSSGRTDEIGDMEKTLEVFKENVVERQRGEVKLRESEERLKNQVEALKYNEERLEAQAFDLIALAENLETAKQEMQHMANHDALTGLPSLRLCKDRLESSLAADRRNKSQTAVLFIDLDGFKAVNDSMGHEAGDEVLKKVAERLKSIIRETDTAARIGGDEFILVLPSSNKKDVVAKKSQKVIDEISKPFHVDGGVANIGASIGIAISPADGTTPEELLRHADESMYAIKKQGKNNYGFFT